MGRIDTENKKKRKHHRFRAFVGVCLTLCREDRTNHNGSNVLYINWLGIKKFTGHLPFHQPKKSLFDTVDIAFFWTNQK